MNTFDMEAAIRGVLQRKSVFEVLTAQFYMFHNGTGRPPTVILLNHCLRVPLAKEMAAMASIDLQEALNATPVISNTPCFYQHLREHYVVLLGERGTKATL